MSLVSMKELLAAAEKGNYGVGAFSVANMEMVLGAVSAAEELCSPMILQVAQVRLPYSPLPVFAPLLLAAAENAKVPVAVHFDHGTDISYIMQALQLGFTSVMIDASRYPMNENIRLTGQVKALADQYGAAVEAEVGQLGSAEDGKAEGEMIYSDPQEVRRLYEETGVDAIALSIGNAHGLYKKEPKLNFEVLKQSKQLVPVPLVLHGGSGISEEDFKNCIRHGIRKINVATATFLAVEQAARNYVVTAEKADYFLLSHQMMLGAYENVKRHILIFGSNGKAGCELLKKHRNDKQEVFYGISDIRRNKKI
ncbi:MAG: class II fructose-bisphosphate aldolase [Lachnospiraceae bacterium]